MKSGPRRDESDWWNATKRTSPERKFPKRSYSESSPCPSFFTFVLMVLVFSSQPTSSANLTPTGNRLRSQKPLGPSRPQPSYDLPIVGLVEPPNKIYDPQPEDLNSRILRERMGDHFETNYMSVQRPLDGLLQPNGTLELSFKKTKQRNLIPTGRMPPEIRRLKLRHFQLANGERLRVSVSKNVRRKMKQFLWAYTYCPVLYKWKDLGVRFWPRWIREGSCLDGGGSCSIPAGMSCKAKRSTGKNILRWHCQDWENKRKCKWLTVSYPIITECACSC